MRHNLRHIFHRVSKGLDNEIIEFKPMIVISLAVTIRKKSAVLNSMVRFEKIVDLLFAMQTYRR